jgi:hypothetical protein
VRGLSPRPADGHGETETRGDPNPKMGQKAGHGDRSGKPKARWIDIGHGGEDEAIMAIPQWDYLLPLAVSHGLVTVTENVSRTRE